MKNKLAKLKYLPNNFNVLEAGDHVICAISGKKIMLENGFLNLILKVMLIRSLIINMLEKDV